MARSNDPLTVTEEDEIWGTWEELLLACAVNRHGAHSWDSVAAEVRSRSPYAHRLTADGCRRRYRHLKRRFSGSEGGDGINGGDESDEKEPTVEIPWLDELRRLRVAELRREVQRYDVSIGSLQLKVKKMKEERERNLSMPEAGGDGDDGGDGVNGSGSRSGSNPKEENGEGKDRVVSPRSTPEIAGGDRVSRQDSGRSCKESNSTEPKAKAIKVEERVKKEADLGVNGSRSGSGPDPVTAASFNGSSDTIARGAVRSPAAEPDPAANDSNESVAESKGGEDEEGAKESSEVQSSASLSRRRRRGWRRRTAAASGEPDAEAVSGAKAADVESQPLIAFLETIRSNKDGSVFDRRLESQEDARYRSLIRRHVDLETVKDRIGGKGYTSVEFFRDLLLLCNNALVFYPKNSPESISAVHLRDLVNKEIATTLRKTPQTSPQSAKEATPPPAQQPHPASSKPKSDSGTSEKPAPLPPLVACRKRSAVTAKPIKPKKVERAEKAEIETTEDEGEIEDENKDREPATNKKSTKQQRTAVSRGLRTNKTRTNTKGGGNAVKNPNPVSTPKPDPVEQDSKSTLAKKRSAADFLNRMKSSSPPETMKGSSSSRRGGGDQRKKTKEEIKREAAAAVKKSVGRPPAKRAPSKRAREEKTPPVAKKRGRR